MSLYKKFELWVIKKLDEPNNPNSKFSNLFVDKYTKWTYLLATAVIICLLGFSICLIRRVYPDGLVIAYGVAICVLLGIPLVISEYCTKIVSPPTVLAVKLFGKPMNMCFSGLHFYIPGIHTFGEVSLEFDEVTIEDPAMFSNDNLHVSFKATVVYQLGIRDPHDPIKPGTPSDNMRYYYRSLNAAKTLKHLAEEVGLATARITLGNYSLKEVMTNKAHIQDTIRRRMEFLLNENNEASLQDPEILKEMESLGLKIEDLNRNKSLLELTGCVVARINITETDPSESLRAVYQSLKEAEVKKDIAAAEGDALIVAARKKAEADSLEGQGAASKELQLLEARAKGQRLLEDVHVETLQKLTAANVSPTVVAVGELANAVVSAFGNKKNT